MTVYLILFFISAILGIINMAKEKEKLKNIYILFIVLLVIITGFRDGLGGTDYDFYTRYFENMEPITSINNFHYYIEYEVFYKYFNSIIRSFTDNAEVLFFIISAITVPAIGFLNYKYCKYPFLTLSFYFYKTFLYSHFVAMRQSIAIVIFLYSLKYLNKDGAKKYFLCIILATLFHSSAIVLILLYFIKDINFKEMKWYNPLLIGVLTAALSKVLIKLSVVGISLLGFSQTVIGKVQNIVDSSSSGINLHVIEAIALYLFFRKFYKIKNEKDKLFYNLFIIYLIGVIGFSQYHLFVRISMYMYFVIMVLLSNSVDNISPNQKRILIIYAFQVIFLVGYMKYLNDFDDGGLMPYKTILFYMF